MLLKHRLQLGLVNLLLELLVLQILEQAALEAQLDPEVRVDFQVLHNKVVVAAIMHLGVVVQVLLAFQHLLVQVQEVVFHNLIKVVQCLEVDLIQDNKIIINNKHQVHHYLEIIISNKQLAHQYLEIQIINNKHLVHLYLEILIINNKHNKVHQYLVIQIQEEVLQQHLQHLLCLMLKDNPNFQLY